MRPDADSIVVTPRPILPAEWFAFIVGWTLRRAYRYNEYLALITIRPTGDPAGSNLEPAMGAFAGIADVIAPAIRDVDLIGECDERTLGILCLDADECAAERCVERLVDAIVCGRFIDPAAF